MGDWKGAHMCVEGGGVSADSPEMRAITAKGKVNSTANSTSLRLHVSST